MWEAIDCVAPRVVVIEYNAKFPPDLSWKQAYNAEHVWDGSDWHGASLKAMEELGKSKGYLLVGTDLRGCNAFFVRQDLVQDKFLPTHTAEELYNPLRMDLVFAANHPARYCLADQIEGIGILNYQPDYELLEGFHKEENENGQTHVWTSAQISRLKILMQKGMDKCVIPYTVPAEVDLMVDVKVNQDASHEKARIEVQSSSSGKIVIDRLTANKNLEIVELRIETSMLWSPNHLWPGNKDKRQLGINLCLTQIKQYKSEIEIRENTNQ